MKKVLAALLFGAAFATTSFAFATPAEAQTRITYSGPRHKFARPRPNPQVLARDIRASLASDPTGRSAIDGPNCGRACGTPEDLVELLNQGHPELRVTLANIADVVGRFESVATTTSDVYSMACKTGNGDVNSEPLKDCLDRAFHAGEPGFGYRRADGTVVIVFARDCTNPVFRRVELADCVRIHTGLRRGSVARATFAGAPLPQGRCTMRLQRPGEDERGSPPTDQCPREDCDFRQVVAESGLRPANWRISYRAEVEGDHTLWVPSEVLRSQGEFWICVQHPDGTQTMTKVVRRDSYVNGDIYISYRTLDITPDSWGGRTFTWRSPSPRGQILD